MANSLYVFVDLYYSAEYVKVIKTRPPAGRRHPRQRR